jgi:hypothetical protein
MIEITVVQGPVCHLCEDAAATIGELARTLPLTLRTVEATSQEGRELLRRTRAPLLPVVLVDGELLGWGRLSRGRLAARLADLSVPAQAEGVR